MPKARDICGVDTGRRDATGPIDCPNPVPCPDHAAPPPSPTSYAASRNGPIALALDQGGWAEDRGYDYQR